MVTSISICIEGGAGGGRPVPVQVQQDHDGGAEAEDGAGQQADRRFRGRLSRFGQTLPVSGLRFVAIFLPDFSSTRWIELTWAEPASTADPTSYYSSACKNS